MTEPGYGANGPFDNLNRLLTRGYPDGGVESFAYTLNVAGPTSYTNQLGTNVVNYSYDPLGRKISEVYPGIATNSFAYDGVGNLRTLTDGKNQVTTWHYDEYGRATNKVDATSTEILRYAYDPDNRLTNRWSAAKTNTTYSFDRVGNLLSIVHPQSGTLSYSYDLLNRLTNMVDGVGTNLYSYTSAGLLLSEDGPWNDDTLSYTYNFQRLRSGLSVLAPNASPWTQGYGYDGAERLTSLTSPAGGFGYNYDAARHAQVGSLTLPNGAFITNTFDSVARLLSTVLKNSSSGVLNSHQYGYNTAGQRTWLTNTFGDYRAFSYDNIGQLTATLGNEATGALRWHEQLSYAYDPAGNLNSRSNNELIQTFNLNSLNELATISRTTNMTVVGTTTSLATNVTVNTLAAALYADATFARTNVGLVDGTNTFTAIASDSLARRDTNSSICYLPSSISYSHDLNGNLLTDGTRDFAYDDENQLTSVWVTNAWRSDFLYDGKMRRRIRREYTWASGNWLQTNEVHYLYDGNLVIQERDVNNLPLVSYTRGRDLSATLQGAGGIGGLLARSDLSTAFYHADANGNITCLINTNQAIVAKYLYDPFGNVLSKAGSLADANLYRFSSKEIHPNSGLIYFGLRFYDPNLQRWVNRDPISEAGGYNLYVFTRNEPVGRFDPQGKNAYVINYGGLDGHTFFVVDNPSGGAMVFDFYANDWHNEHNLYGALRAFTLDPGYIESQKVGSARDFLSDVIGNGGIDVRITAMGFGTGVDDGLLIDALTEMAASPPFYSIPLQEQCHTRAEQWFYTYVEGGTEMDISALQFAARPYPELGLPQTFWVTASLLRQSVYFK